MKNLRLFALATCLFSPAIARDFRPAGHLEKIPLANSSVQECYVFQTTAGVAYTVEISNNLSGWTAQDELYGLGGEYAVTMREFTPPPPPPPGTPPVNPPTLPKNVSLRIQPASGAAGGSVVAWPSLDHTGPVIVRIAGEMDQAWNQIPIFWNRYGDYNFSFWHPGPVIAPPIENPPLGPKDTAMLAALEASIPEINQQIAASLIQVRNAPPPAPPDPDSKRFWRVKVDWSLDTDQDGSPDWAEFEIAASGTGMLVPGVVGDAFNADTNNDGIPDGQQLDADKDGTPDANDPDPNDNTATFPIGPVPRYALFPITNAVPTTEWPFPIQINDKGTVLYANGTWKAGVWTPLTLEVSGQITHASARGINDSDTILGIGYDNAVSNATAYHAGLLCYWPTPTDLPSIVEIGGQTRKRATNIEIGTTTRDLFENGLYPGPVLANDGGFYAPVNHLKEDLSEWIYQYHSRWKLPSNGQPLTEIAASPALRYSTGSELQWGFDPAQTNGITTAGGLIVAAGSPPVLPFMPTNVIVQPGGSILAMPAHGTHDAQAFVKGAWKVSPTYAKAIDMAADGTAIGKAHGELKNPICINGKWVDIVHTVPEVAADWKDNSVKFMDTTSGGWILAERSVETNSNTQTKEYAAMLPLRITETPADPKFLEATGVDAYSIMSKDPGMPVLDKIWIMAPAGGGATKVTVKSPLNPQTPIELSADGIKFDTNPKITLTADNQKFDVTASNPSSTGSDIPLTLKLGTLQTPNTPLEALSRPLGVKIMKRRTVNISLHPLGSWVEGRASNEPDTVPTKPELEEYLNKVFTPQINAVFVVKMVPARNFEWDTATPADYGAQDPNNHLTVGNGWLDGNGANDGDNPYNEDRKILNGLNDEAANINIYILGGGRIRTVLNWDNTIRVINSIVLGNTRVKKNTIFIDGDIGWYHRALDRDPGQEQLRTIAHEVGHCLVGEGHADTGDAIVKLGGFNPSSLVQERLMATGDKTRHPIPGCRLVKGEWDEAEKWMRKEELAGRMQP